MTVGRFINLCLFKVRADLTSESKRTYMGFLWWIVDPVIWMFVFYLVFVVLLERRSEDFTDFLLCGLVFWRWFAQSVANAQLSIKAGNALMQQIYIPKEFFVVVSVTTSLVKTMIMATILLAYLWVFAGYEIGDAVVALPLLILLEFTLILGASFITAAVLPLLPDLRFVVDNLLLAGMFLSGIFYDGRELSPEKQELFYLNPMAKLIESIRIVLLENRWPDFGDLIYPALWALGALIIGIAIIRALDRSYPRIVRVR